MLPDIYNPPDVKRLTPDARLWYEQGVKNANINLHPNFETIATLLTQGTKPADGEPLLMNHLQALYSQVQDANRNLKVVMANLTELVKSLQKWAQDHISLCDMVKLKSIMWYLDGKRDNKSYYLFNGAALWCKERADLLTAMEEVDTVKFVKQDLVHFKELILNARDALDDSAKIYVKGVEQLVELVKDVESNGEEIRKIVGDLKTSGDRGRDAILKSGDDAEEAIKARMVGSQWIH